MAKIPSSCSQSNNCSGSAAGAPESGAAPVLLPLYAESKSQSKMILFRLEEVWNIMIKTNAKWQPIDRFWFLGGWIHPCQMFDFGENRLKTLTLWIGHLKGIVRYFGSKIWKMRIKTNAKWQQFCRIWFLGGWIDPCQMFDFRENCLKTLTLWLGHLKGLVR